MGKARAVTERMRHGVEEMRAGGGEDGSTPGAVTLGGELRAKVGQTLRHVRGGAGMGFGLSGVFERSSRSSGGSSKHGGSSGCRNAVRKSRRTALPQHDWDEDEEEEERRGVSDEDDDEEEEVRGDEEDETADGSEGGTSPRSSPMKASAEANEGTRARGGPAVGVIGYIDDDGGDLEGDEMATVTGSIAREALFSRPTAPLPFQELTRGEDDDPFLRQEKTKGGMD